MAEDRLSPTAPRPLRALLAACLSAGNAASRAACSLAVVGALLAGPPCTEAATPDAGSPAASAAQGCGRDGETALLVTGAGGPMHGEGRGSAAYLLLHQRRPAALIDIGGDVPTALARAGVDPGDIRMILISHLHPDHVAGLADFLWGEMVRGRQAPLTLVGPSGSERFPALDDFLQRQFGAGGVYPFMAGLLDGEPFALDARVVDARREASQEVLQTEDLRIAALPVPHGSAPALAFRIDGPAFRVVFAGDQTARLGAFPGFAEKANLLVAHAILHPQAADSPLADVVALPRELAHQADAAAARHLVLGHLMDAPGEQEGPWSLRAPQDLVAVTRANYRGAVTLAADGQCIGIHSRVPREE